MFSKYLRLGFFIPLLLVAMLAAACGSTTTGSSTSPTATSAPAAVATTPATSPPVVMTASATVKGKSVTILTDAQGMTLYLFTPDTTTASSCSGGCAQAWPPLLFTGSGTPTSSTTLPGTLKVVNTTNGAQVEYQGHLLYTFAKDTAPGQTTGEGVGGKWFVVTTDVTPMTDAASGSTPTPSASNGYGYGY